MKIDAKQLYSDLARNGPPLFFPDADQKITFNFDQGIAAEETFPLDDLEELAGEVLQRATVGGRWSTSRSASTPRTTRSSTYRPTSSSSSATPACASSCSRGSVRATTGPT